MKKYALLLLIGISLILYALTIRGNIGTPTPKQIEFDLSPAGKVFETSQERSRYAIILSLANFHSINIDNYASMGTPDIGRINGHYYSFFPIGASLIAYPLYQIGLLINAPQMMVFSVSTIFAFLTMLLIYEFTKRLGTHWSISVLSALSFGFATNAWGYSVTFYAHLISGFLILCALYLTVFPFKLSKTFSALLVWILYSIAVFVDFPNLFIFLPIVITMSMQAFNLEKTSQKFKLSFSLKYILTPLIFIVLMLCYAQYNKVNFGNYTTLSNAIPRVKDLKDVNLSIPETGKDAVGALNTRNMLEGFNSFLISRDRGVLFYSPVVLLSLLGIGFLKNAFKKAEILLVATPLMCLVLYTMFGDPYGGWAFGSRYVIAVFPELVILAGLGFQRFSRNLFSKILFSVVISYSAAVSLLSPLTTNVIPPFVEARNLGLASDYSININMLMKNDLNSFIFNSYARHHLTGVYYYLSILALVLVVFITLIWIPKKQK